MNLTVTPTPSLTAPLVLWPLITLQILMGAFDTFYHHEMSERLAWPPTRRRELQPRWRRPRTAP